MTDGGTPGDSDDDPPPWVMEDFDPLELEGLQLRDSGGIHRMESGSGTVGNGRLPPSVSDLDSNSLLKEVDTESNTEEPAAFTIIMSTVITARAAIDTAAATAMVTVETSLDAVAYTSTPAW